MKFQRKQLQVYFIAGTQDVKKGSLEEILEKALAAGITMFQFREKGPSSLSGEAKERKARSLMALCRQYHVPFIVNDDVALAIKIGADGIHVGQDDAKIETFIDQSKDKIIGLSISDFKEYDQSDLTHVDYIGVGPVYHTSSKTDAKQPGGVEMIRRLREYDETIPIVAIGGITEENVASLKKNGADGVATISSITHSSNIEKTVSRYLKYFN
ncbi:thiamine phosphate synthase [Staphylococcus chromogenes]|uniref:thiamine phosphate synthase n=1 Tax=Staphylococcus chromogenes TaxID=46126 RepID=UPI000D1AD39C|nr:thiamine phosphate synthase [Staphylococcus chromogenes]MDU0451959.1 thiamine phosphate synthase [Staphylococcus chromogenes]PTF80811.1 thiamine phosphate synthase [Staphylococcus chromogenes]PTG07473.1 thiamine phosphate synthase [Staphylococcus chromogenes]PTG58153.1 thiamine phosphate synthase [Staphylococcus chromogenes]RIM17925.1 thiamine phosphate synthase [Staphylococcus chromogenes]